MRTSLTLLTLLLLPTVCVGATLMVRGPFGGYLKKEVVSLREARYRGMVPQRYDFSCGAASLATIMKFYYGLEVSEEEIVKGMIDLGDAEKIKKEGFSLLDLKRYATKRGFVANGYRIKAEDLHKLKIPAVVLLNTRGYSHFVVLKGTKDGQIYVADPAAGNRSLELGEFKQGWNGIIFVIYKKVEGHPFALQSRPEAPVERVLSIRDLGIGIGVWGPLRPPGAF